MPTYGLGDLVNYTNHAGANLAVLVETMDDITHGERATFTGPVVTVQNSRFVRSDHQVWGYTYQVTSVVRHPTVATAAPDLFIPRLNDRHRSLDDYPSDEPAATPAQPVTHPSPTTWIQ